MKWYVICLMAMIMVSSVSKSEAQSTNSNLLAEAKPIAPENAKELTITIKNDCENHVFVFAGSKKEVFDGKGQSLGGLSVNTVYLKEGDVVCIMNSPKAIQACSIPKDGISKIEINKSGNGFVK